VLTPFFFFSVRSPPSTTRDRSLPFPSYDVSCFSHVSFFNPCLLFPFGPDPPMSRGLYFLMGWVQGMGLLWVFCTLFPSHSGPFSGLFAVVVPSKDVFYNVGLFYGAQLSTPFLKCRGVRIQRGFPFLLCSGSSPEDEVLDLEVSFRKRFRGSVFYSSLPCFLNHLVLSSFPFSLFFPP